MSYSRRIRARSSERIDGRGYWLQRKGEDNVEIQSQGKPHELLRFNDPILKGTYPKEYRYNKLPGDKKRIRLLKLYPGQHSGAEIFCELMEVQYDTDFHIPVPIENEGSKIEDETSDTADHLEGSGSDDDPRGERSDLEESHLNRIKQEGSHEMSERMKRQAEAEMRREIKDKNPEEKIAKEKEAEKLQQEKLEIISKDEVAYEALSWHWGNEEEDYAVLIKVGKRTFRKSVRKELALALKYLRRPGEERTLWIDAICINQANPNERNHQVQMMSRVYTRAQRVCIWLGEADQHTDIAFRFMMNDIKELKNFDTITSDEQYSRKWQALMALMQRDWFHRRWVIQEIALARAATVYCGPHEISWKSFAVAVELFVEVETATHRLSEVMGRDEKFRHVPGWFEYVSELGASLLVSATGKVFRTKELESPMQPDAGRHDGGKTGAGYDDKKDEAEAKRLRLKELFKETSTIDPLERRSLLSLEYLVSTMFTFQASEPRDVVYALLAIARDATAFAPAHHGQEDQKLFLVMNLLDDFLAEKPFVVDYNRQYSDVSKDFVKFSIERMHKIDPHQALDILCRPWALKPPLATSKRSRDPETRLEKGPRLMRRRHCWSKRLRDSDGVKYSLTWISDDRSLKAYVKDAPLLGHQDFRKPGSEPRTEEVADLEPRKPWTDFKNRYFPDSCKSRPGTNSCLGAPDVKLPSWVCLASQAPFILDNAPGIDMRKTSRANADPLVGAPLDGHRNYNASGSQNLSLVTLKFRKRPVLDHYSMYVHGFDLDTVESVKDASQLGAIPSSWLELGGWLDLTQDPPDEFWRTIVADRGRDNKNPPYYYARACKESVNKGNYLGGSVNTSALINDEQNSIIAEFCRRVHAVIWNRCLFRTENGRLGLAQNGVKEGDKVCILYGCTVPVILQEKKKETDLEGKVHTEFNREVEEDRVETLKDVIRRAVRNREQKGKYREKRDTFKKDWQMMMDARQSYLNGKRAEDAKARSKKAGEDRERISNREKKKAREEWAKNTMEAEKAVEQAKKQSEEAKQRSDEAKKSNKKAKDANYAMQNRPGTRSAAVSPIEDEDIRQPMEQEAHTSRLMETEQDGRKKDKELETAKENLEKAKGDLEKAEEVLKKVGDEFIKAVEEEGQKEAAETTSDGDAAGEGPHDHVWNTDWDIVKEPTYEEQYFYKFKGECYLHGMMDGEAMREKFYEGFAERTFQLR